MQQVRFPFFLPRGFLWMLVFCLFSVLPVRADRQALLRESIKDIRVLSPEWICVVVDPTAEMLAYRHERFGADLDRDLDNFINKRGNSHWYFEKSVTHRSIMAMRDFQQPLFARMNQKAFWRVNGKAPADVTVWAHSVDGLPAVSADHMPTHWVYSPLSRIAHMVYLKLDTPLRPGQTLEVLSADGRRASLTFSEDSTIAWSIKVNQSAYDLNAGQKIAYLGMWIPGVGPADFESLDGQPFDVLRFEAGNSFREGRVVGAPVANGVVRLRRLAADQEVRREGGANLTGEDVYELDFSGLREEGLFAIQIPGLGRSWPFEVSTAGYGAAYFTMMKGLFIQRSGVPLSRPHTGWERPTCFTETRPGHFVAESEPWYGRRYRNDAPRSFGFRNEKGEQVGLSQFTLVGNSDRSLDPIPGVWGGWHDAADYDRRYFHYHVVWDLLALAETRPGAFPDGQLNMPESGNGIPDLLDEAAWGVDVWRRTQRPDGAVSSWIEQASHPSAGENLITAFVESDRDLPFFLSIPDRTGSYAYAAAAAWLGRLLRPHAPERAAAYIASAERAFAWAESDASVMRGLRFHIQEPMRDRALQGQTLLFDEDPEIRPSDRAFVESALAAANLYLATRKDQYLQAWTRMNFAQRLPEIGQGVNPAQLVPVLLNEGFPAEDVAHIRRRLLERADLFLDAQENHPYRMYWHAPDAGWFHTLGWGNFHRQSRNLTVAWLLTGEPRYHSALQHAANFFLGANPQGTSMITGIGSVFPVVIQHIHSKNDGIAEPTPGIAPYWLTYGVNLIPFYVAQNGHPSVDSFYEPTALAFVPDKLGREEIQRTLDAAEKTGNWTWDLNRPVRAAVWDNFPILRRRAIHPTHVVDQNEFTVNETISPLALMFGALTAEGWMPPPRVRHREPERDMRKLPYYSMP